MSLMCMLCLQSSLASPASPVRQPEELETVSDTSTLFIRPRGRSQQVTACQSEVIAAFKGSTLRRLCIVSACMSGRLREGHWAEGGTALSLEMPSMWYALDRCGATSARQLLCRRSRSQRGSLGAPGDIVAGPSYTSTAGIPGPCAGPSLHLPAPPMLLSANSMMCFGR